MAEALGWLKLTAALEPIEKLCQFRMAEFELCVICMFEPELEIVALPAATLPPVGSVFGVVCAMAVCAIGMSAAVTASAIRFGVSTARHAALAMVPPRRHGLL